MAKDLQRMTKAELIAQIRELERSADGGEPRRSREKLWVYQDQMSAQAEQLVETQRALAESYDRFMGMYHAAPVAFATLDHNGVIDEINQTGLTLLGLGREQVVKRPLLVFVVKDDRQLFLNHLTRCRKADRPCATELRLNVRGAAPVLVQLTTRPATRPKLGGTCYLTAITDLTELRAAEAEQQRLALQEQVAQAASDAKDRFLAVLSHELRTPLTPIMAVVSSLARQEDLPEQIKADMEMIRRNVQMEAQLIDDLLDVTRVAHNKVKFNFQVVDAHHVAREAVQMLTSDMNGRDLHVKLELESAEHTVWADPARLRQVLWNLLANAIKFTPDGGTITVRTHNRTASLGIHVAEPGPQDGQMRGALELEVSDTGIGIEPEVLPRLFRPFEQASDRPTAVGGLGLGLSICRGLVESHGGRIRAASAGRGQGATLTVELAAVAQSAAEAPPAPAPGADAEDSRSRRKLRILLVEDHPDTARIMSQLLSAEGHEVRAAHTMQAALREAESRLDLIISDIGLPDGTGLELMREIRHRQDVRGIALSGFGADTDIERSRDAGFDEHLTKPIDFSRLLETIHRLALAATA